MRKVSSNRSNSATKNIQRNRINDPPSYSSYNNRVVYVSLN